MVWSNATRKSASISLASASAVARRPTAFILPPPPKNSSQMPPCK
jgi:hypothetical protein